MLRIEHVAFPPSLPMKVAAKGRRKKKRHLGFTCDKLDRILSGLGLQPNGKRARVDKLVLDLTGSYSRPIFGLVSGPVSGLVFGLVSGLVFSLDLGTISSASDSVSVFNSDLGPGSVITYGLAPLPLVSLGVATVGFGSSLVVPSPSALDPVLSTRLVPEPDTTTVFGSAMPAGSPCLFDSTHLGFGLSKSQIWLFEWIKDRLKINEEAKDEDHLVFLKGMEEDFHWINSVAREQGWLEVDEEDIHWISMVACEEGRWEVNEEEGDRNVAWLIEMKEELRLTVVWPRLKSKIVFL
jgi:hypothetical protein